MVKKLGKYEILGELGRGAFGIVYRARDPVINRMVALKTMSAYVADNPGLLQRFYREAQSAGSLQHPNIVTIYDMGEENGTPFIAMELVEGRNLEDVILGRPAIPVALKLVYAMQACRALDYAHKRGIIHRDIKPGNMMVNKEGTVKVVDFGIARILETSKTQTGMLIGTFSYMAPEVFHGEHATARSDIWSFGVSLYELLAYQRPFAGDSPAALMKSVCLRDPAPLRQVAQECPEDLESVVHHMLVKVQGERFQTMEDVIAQLEPICRRLQAQTMNEYLAQSQQLIERRKFEQARDLLCQALQVDSTSSQAKLLSEKVNAELKRLAVRPRVEEHVGKGHSLLREGKLHEANVEAGDALSLDSLFEPARELRREVQCEIERRQQVNAWLALVRQRLVEGLPDEAAALLAKVQEADPSNRRLPELQQQVLEEKSRRERQVRLFGGVQRARALWTQRKYQDCIDLLKQLQKEFPGEGDVEALLETAGEDQLEHNKQERLTQARSLLADRRYQECTAILSELQADFPADDEIRRLLETARSDEAEVRKEESLADVRQLLTARRYEECIALLENIQAQFGNDSDVQKLLDTAREYRAEQHKRERMAQARTLLSGRRYEACINLLTELQQELPDDEEVSKSLETARQDQAEYARRQKLEEARDLLAAQRFTDAMAVLEAMLSANPQDSAVLKLRSLILREQEKESRAQRLRTEWERLKKLVSEKAYTEVVTQGEELLREFPGDADLVRLVGFARGQQAQTEQELRLTKAVEQVQELMKAGRFAEASASARASLESFPQNSKLEILLQEAQAQEKKEMVRQLIERRVREIKVKINAGELSDAKKLAQETLDTLGPDTDIRQLLSSAEIEHDAREKRRLQDQKLETIRSLVRAGKLDEASTTLDEVVTKGDFHAFDPRVYQVADEIESARQAGATTSPAEVEDQPAPHREYAMLQGPPPPSEAAPDPPAIEPVAMAPPAPPAPASNPPPTLMTGIVGPRTDNLPDVERRLATFIGPVAKILVKKAAARTSDTGELYNQLAASLEREADRRAFLASVAEVSHISTTGHAPPQPSGLVSGAGKTAAPGSPELTREAIEHAARLLAPYVGPISSVLAKRVAQRADSLRAFYRLLAEHVDDETQRARFLHESGFAA